MRTRRDQLVEAHGPALGSVLYDAEVNERARDDRRFLQQQSELSALTAQIAAASQAATARLAPLRANADAAYQAWLESCELLEQARLKNEATIMPLREQAAQLHAQMNLNPFHSRVRQWEPVAETTPAPGGRQ